MTGASAEPHSLSWLIITLFKTTAKENLFVVLNLDFQPHKHRPRRWFWMNLDRHVALRSVYLPFLHLVITAAPFLNSFSLGGATSHHEQTLWKTFGDLSSAWIQSNELLILVFTCLWKLRLSNYEPRCLSCVDAQHGKQWNTDWESKASQSHCFIRCSALTHMLSCRWVNLLFDRSVSELDPHKGFVRTLFKGELRSI